MPAQNLKPASLTFFLALAWTAWCSGQSPSLTGSVLGADGRPLESATVNLLKNADSSLVKIELTDADGHFEFQALKPGAYLLAVQLIGYEKQYSQPLQLDNRPLGLPAITLKENSATLKEVTVAAQKPFIERRTDRMIVNVENSILATGSSAMDVLERSPGVVISSSDDISLRGRQGVIVMVDGKPTPLSGQDLSNFLRTLPSNSIERIEIITNPSAKYDAAGNAGIIDIRTKKDGKLGTNGSFSMNYAQGIYPKAGAGINLNHRNKKLNLFGNYNYSYRKGLNDLRLYRTFFEDGARTGAYDQRNYMRLPYNTQLARAGADFFPDQKTTIGVLASGSVNFLDQRAQNTSTVEDQDSEVASYFGTSNLTHSKWFSYAFNGNFKRSFGEKGRELSADLDYARYWSDSQQHFTTKYTGLDGAPLKPDYLLYGDIGGELQIRSAKADYSHPFDSKTKFEAGAKVSVVDADNDLKFYDESTPGAPVFDSTNSNHFIYRENINAGYVNFSRDWDKLSIQAGLRAENTRAKGTQLVNGESFNRNYTNWFPSLFFNYKFSEKYESGLNLSRRLDRPSYRQLNPFKVFLDPSTYSAGNPYLNPQFTWSVEWNNTLWQRLHLTVSWARTSDNITQVIAPVGSLDRVTVQTDSNLATVTYLNFTGSYNFNLTKWWSTVNNLTIYRGDYSGNLANTQLQDGNVVFDFNTSQNFKFHRDWSGELNFVYHSREVYGFMDLNPMWGLGMGVQKMVMNKRGTLKLALTDIFWKNLPSATIRFRDYTETFEVFRETRTITLSFNYRFGNNNVAPSRRRQGGAEEEKQRAGNG